MRVGGITEQAGLVPRFQTRPRSPRSLLSVEAPEFPLYEAPNINNRLVFPLSISLDIGLLLSFNFSLENLGLGLGLGF